MVGLASPDLVPTDPPPYWEIHSSEIVPENPMTDDEAITWFREALPKRYKCDSCSAELKPNQLIYQV